MAISNENTAFTNSKDFEELPNSELEKEKRKSKKSKFGGVYQNAMETYLQNMQRSFNNINVETNSEQKNSEPETEEPKIMTPSVSKNKVKK